MSRCLSKGKEIEIDVPSPVAKQTCRSTQSSQVSNNERFRTPFDSQTYLSIFIDAHPIVEHVVKFDTLGTTFILRIFEARDWANLFGNFEDPVDELVKEFYSNARYTEVELKCWVRGTKFSINLEYIAKVLRITRPANVNLTPYDDRLLQVQDIIQVLGPDYEVRSKGSSIGTAQFSHELTTLKLIMFSNLYPLSNTAFINLGRAQFLCDLITGVPIDICAHIFQTIMKIEARSAARTCIPFCNLVIKIMLLEDVHPPTDGKIISRPRPISMITLHASKSHSSKTPKSEPFSHATPSGHDSTTPVHTTIVSPIPSERQTTGTPSARSSQDDRLSTLIKGLYQRISGLEKSLYSTNNHVQMHLTTIETQLDAIQQKLEKSL